MIRIIRMIVSQFEYSLTDYFFYHFQLLPSRVTTASHHFHLTPSKTCWIINYETHFWLIFKWQHQVLRRFLSFRSAVKLKSLLLTATLSSTPSISCFVTHAISGLQAFNLSVFLCRSSLKRLFPKSDRATLPWTTLCCSITRVVSTCFTVLLLYLLTFTESGKSIQLNDDKL